MNSSTSITIKRLNINEEQTLLELADVLHNEFGSLKAHSSLEERIDRLKIHANQTTGIPATFVAYDNKKSTWIGTISAVTYDIANSPYTPWLASLYVRHKYRKQGIGEELIAYLTSYIKQLNYKTLYLFTTMDPSYYERLGWNSFEKMIYNNHYITLMKKSLF